MECAILGDKHISTATSIKIISSKQERHMKPTRILVSDVISLPSLSIALMPVFCACCGCLRPWGGCLFRYAKVAHVLCGPMSHIQNIQKCGIDFPMAKMNRLCSLRVQRQFWGSTGRPISDCKGFRDFIDFILRQARQQRCATLEPASQNSGRTLRWGVTWRDESRKCQGEHHMDFPRKWSFGNPFHV